MLTHEQVKSQVQELIGQYFAGDNEAAGQAFEILMQHEWKKKAYRTAQKLRGDLNDARSLFAEKFMDALGTYDPQKGAFVHYVNRLVTNAIINAGKKSNTRSAKELHIGASTGDKGDKVSEDTFFGAKDEADVFTQATEIPVFEKEAAMRAIVSDIMKAAKPEELEVVMAYADAGSYRKAGEQLGINQVKVMRTLEKVKKYYDSDKYGDIADYFTVETVTSRKGGRK